MKSRRRGAKNTVRRARLLENGVHGLYLRGFHVFRNAAEVKRYLGNNHRLPPRYIRLNYAAPSLYNTPGRKEAFIHCDNAGDFILEAKYQNKSGSVDEKCPYLWEAFLVSSVPNWIVWFDGNWFQYDRRGRAVVEWLRTRVAANSINGRSFYIATGDDEFWPLLDKLFEQQPKDVPKAKAVTPQMDLFSCMD